jgi:hypothetical protein
LVALDVDDLAQRVVDADQIGRVLHDHVDVLVGIRVLIEERVGVSHSTAEPSPCGPCNRPLTAPS